MHSKTQIGNKDHSRDIGPACNGHTQIFRKQKTRGRYFILRQPLRPTAKSKLLGFCAQHKRERTSFRHTKGMSQPSLPSGVSWMEDGGGWRDRARIRTTKQAGDLITSTRA